MDELVWSQLGLACTRLPNSDKRRSAYVRKETKTLGEWVNKQRALKRMGRKSMTPARIEELNSIDGWLWDIRKKD